MLDRRRSPLDLAPAENALSRPPRFVNCADDRMDSGREADGDATAVAAAAEVDSSADRGADGWNDGDAMPADCLRFTTNALLGSSVTTSPSPNELCDALLPARSRAPAPELARSTLESRLSADGCVCRGGASNVGVFAPEGCSVTDLDEPRKKPLNSCLMPLPLARPAGGFPGELVLGELSTVADADRSTRVTLNVSISGGGCGGGARDVPPNSAGDCVGL